MRGTQTSLSMKSPVFIIGNPRSGTTLLRLMLTCHPHIVIPPECGFALWLYPRYGDWEAQDNDTRLSDFIADLMCCRKIETWRLCARALAGFLRSKRPSSYAVLTASVYEFYASGMYDLFKRWGDKNNCYLDQIAGIKRLFPDVVFLHIVRDGRSVSCSYRDLKTTKMESRYVPDLPARLEDSAAHWKANLETIIRAFDAISWQNVHELRFEDLVSDPESTLRRVCSQLGEVYAPDMLDYHRVNRERQLEPKEFLQWKAKTLRPPIAAEAFRYEGEMTSSERRIFESIAAPILRRYRYL